MSDYEVAESAIADMDLEAVQVPVEEQVPPVLVTLTENIVVRIVVALVAGWSYRRIREKSKELHPANKSLTWGQIKMVDRLRQERVAELTQE